MSEKKDYEGLRREISTLLAARKGTFAVAFKDLATGDTLLINERLTFHAASTMKTPVMAEVFRQASRGRFSLSDSIVIHNRFRSIADSSTFSLRPEDDSEQELYRMTGKKKAVRDLVYDMIIVSSNLATNLIIELVGAAQVTETMRAHGAAGIRVLRGVEDTRAFEQGLNNTTTAFDLMVIYEKIALGEMVDPDASRDMVNILLDQRSRDIIPAGLPDGTRVAHKTGSISGVRHDSGIVFRPDGSAYVLVLLSQHLEDEEVGTAALAEVSRKIYAAATR